MVPALARFVRCSMEFTTSYWQKERWSRRAADTLTSYGRCWKPNPGNWDLNWGAILELPAAKMIRFHKSAQDGYKNKSSSNAHSQQRTVDQIYLCGKVQSHTTLALAVAKGSTPEFMKD